MKNIFDHIEHVKAKPHHIRKQVAFGVAAGTSALIGLIWLVGSFETGAFAIQGSNFAMGTGQESAVATTSASGDQGLAGVAAASALQDASAPAHIEIVDTSSQAPQKSQSDQTILPF
ncbi:MAG: hypothetical protein ACYC48_02805 [Minisyncoccota bacterium]